MYVYTGLHPVVCPLPRNEITMSLDSSSTSRFCLVSHVCVPIRCEKIEMLGKDCPCFPAQLELPQQSGPLPYQVGLAQFGKRSQHDVELGSVGKGRGSLLRLNIFSVLCDQFGFGGGAVGVLRDERDGSGDTF